MTETPQDIWFIYDGDCPICQTGASFYKVRQSVGKVVTVDARTEKNHPVLLEVNKARLNLDDGMVIKFNGTLYQGAAALHLMATLGADEGILNTINNALFKNEALAKTLYPYMRMGRNIALKIKGIGNINNLDD